MDNSVLQWRRKMNLSKRAPIHLENWHINSLEISKFGSVDKYLRPVRYCIAVNNDKQEVEWISYDDCLSKDGQLSGCARRCGQVLLPLIPEEFTSMTWVLRRAILTEDVVVLLLHCYCARL